MRNMACPASTQRPLSTRISRITPLSSAETITSLSAWTVPVRRIISVKEDDSTVVTSTLRIRV